MVRHQTTAAGKNDRVLERIPQLADIPVPRPLLQRSKSLRRQDRPRAAVLGGKHGQKMIR